MADHMILWVSSVFDRKQVEALNEAQMMTHDTACDEELKQRRIVINWGDTDEEENAKVSNEQTPGGNVISNWKCVYGIGKGSYAMINCQLV